MIQLLKDENIIEEMVLTSNPTCGIAGITFNKNNMNITHENEIKHEDTILVSVMTKYHERSKRGVRKYGTNLDRKDVDLLGWLNHLQEELMDATLYIEKLKKEVK